MDKVEDILIYLYRNYPSSNQLSFSRTMKLLYLIDWRFAITNFEKLTTINWTLTKYGPYYNNLIQVFEESACFDIITKIDENNNQQLVIKFIDNSKILLKSESAKISIDFVIDHCKNLTWSELNNIVNSTYGVIKSNLNEIIDVVSLAREYKHKS